MPRIIIIFICILLSSCSALNSYRKEGVLHVPGLSQDVKIIRDEKGMAYIYASNLDDVMFAQGFITAQDRLFQMSLTRLFAAGRISEVVGPKTLDIDIRMRTLGFLRNAKRHEAILDTETHRVFSNYIRGINTYIVAYKSEHPFEFKLAGIKPETWRIADCLSILYYMAWGSAGNLKAELISQMLVDKIGVERAHEIFPLSINPDDLSQEGEDTRLVNNKSLMNRPPEVYLKNLELLKLMIVNLPLTLGSNNWVVGPNRSPGKKPVVANDPHLDVHLLPIPWYPSGLITPDFRAVGVTIPGIPGMIVGRNAHVAIGVTNAYGDNQDAYIETIDPKNPNNYLEGAQSIPFNRIEEQFRIKDNDQPDGFRTYTHVVRLTKRGPIINDIMPYLNTKKVISLRWAPYERMSPTIDLQDVLRARSVQDVRLAFKNIDIVTLNLVFGDTKGNTGWLASGIIPIRKNSSGILPTIIKDQTDDWEGWIPFEEMPQSYNPKKGWIGTCNHKTVTAAYPYYYSNSFAQSFRYLRLKELIGQKKVITLDDHWQFQQDTLNTMAKSIAPIMAKTLVKHPETKDIGILMESWDYHDSGERAEPLVFQAVYGNFAKHVFEDELGKEVCEAMLGMWYFWQERLFHMVIRGESQWFDDINTPNVVETLELLFYRAALEAKENLIRDFGTDMADWRWGEAHTLEFVNSIRREGVGKSLLGGGQHGMSGSGETLLRAAYDYHKPYRVIFSDSLRMVSDLNDDQKVIINMPGGVSGRLFDPHYKDQIDSFINGEKRYWWFSDQKIQAHKKYEYTLSSAIVD